MNIDITPPHPQPMLPPPAPLQPAPAWGGGGWGDNNSHIDMNMNIDIHIIMNMNSILGVAGPLPGPYGARRNRFGTAYLLFTCNLDMPEASHMML